jgi:hypothetical protein
MIEGSQGTYPLDGPDRRSGLFLSPLRRGTKGGLSILGTPCRKERGVPLAKGDKLSLLAREMYKLENEWIYPLARGHLRILVDCVSDAMFL